MLKANELRIGNYYMFADYEGIVYRSIQEIKHNQFGLIGDCDGTNFEICKPIPLTQEWLVKFGFKNDNDPDYFYLELPSGFIIHFTPFSSGISTYDDGSQTNQLSIKLTYVHQLQNLYFALTGEELVVVD